jgi:hypothetical protein
MMESWNSFCSDRLTKQAPLRRELTEWFKGLLGRRDATSAKSRNRLPPPARRQQELLCGLDATNAILSILGKPQLDRDNLDEVNAALADMERNLRDDGLAPDLHLRPEGDYPLLVLSNALRLYAEVELERTSDSSGVVPGTYLLGNGWHWQTASNTSGNWILHDNGLQYPIGDIAQLLRNRRHLGGAFLVKPLVPLITMEMDPNPKGSLASAALGEPAEGNAPARKQAKPSAFLQTFVKTDSALPPPAVPPPAPTAPGPAPSAEHPFQVPQVKCANHRSNPSQTNGRQYQHPVYLSKCTNCLREASSCGHTPAQPLVFVDAETLGEFMDQFKDLAALDDEDVV